MALRRIARSEPNAAAAHVDPSQISHAGTCGPSSKMSHPPRGWCRRAGAISPPSHDAAAPPPFDQHASARAVSRNASNREASAPRPPGLITIERVFEIRSIASSRVYNSGCATRLLAAPLIVDPTSNRRERWHSRLVADATVAENARSASTSSFFGALVGYGFSSLVHAPRA